MEGVMRLIILLLAITHAFNASQSMSTSRKKRNLIYTPTNSIVQLIMGTGVPVPLEDQQALTLGWVLKAAYGLPNNASYFTNPYVTFQKRSLESETASRFEIYKAMESAVQIFGGKGCVLRAVCETSNTPFKASGIIGKILHIIFSPSSTNEKAVTPEEREYEAAARLGSEQDVSCSSKFPECTQSILDVITLSI